ncbi:MAG: hypothetical protein ACM3Y9_15835, partial [Ignavibacteria bacterium]
MLPELFRRSGWIATAAVAAVGLSLSAAAWHWVAKSEDAEALAIYESAAERFVSRAQARMRAEVQLLHAFAALGLLQRADKPLLEAYVDELDVPLQYPGIRTLGYVEEWHDGDAERAAAAYVQIAGAGEPVTANANPAAKPG